ncbi:leucine-rich repeat domain-containing protein [Sulfurimonas indica]|uniref:leucine-rich repeat domain-containing protein n=1 Tax=Sulfurimonas indica TaxID=2508707 RepID=UPI0012646677|nr:leucine-rich repeat domain-containing protein [Sulfurimonas indica]
MQVEEIWVEKLLTWADEYKIDELIGKSKEELLSLEFLEISFKKSGKSDGFIPQEIEHLQNLETLILDSVFGLEELPVAIPRFKKLKILRLIRLRLPYILDSDLYLPTLEELIIVECGFHIRLPALPKPLYNLKKLVIHHNENLFILHFIKQFPNLEELEFCHVPLFDFPRALLEIKSLKSIMMHFTEVRTLPPEIINLQNLEVLACNSLHQVPEEVCNLSKLKAFDYGMRALEVLPSSIDKLIAKGFIKLKNRDYIETIETLYNKELLKYGFEIVASYDEFIPEGGQMKIVTHRYKQEPLVRHISYAVFEEEYQQMDRYIEQMVKRKFFNSSGNEELSDVEEEYQEYLREKQLDDEMLFHYHNGVDLYE